MSSTNTLDSQILAYLDRPRTITDIQEHLLGKLVAQGATDGLNRALEPPSYWTIVSSLNRLKELQLIEEAAYRINRKKLFMKIRGKNSEGGQRTIMVPGTGSELTLQDLAVVLVTSEKPQRSFTNLGNGLAHLIASSFIATKEGVTIWPDAIAVRKELMSTDAWLQDMRRLISMILNIENLWNLKANEEVTPTDEELSALKRMSAALTEYYRNPTRGSGNVSE